LSVSDHGTLGNKTGEPRTVPVMCFEDGWRPVVIASAGGSPAHPAWFRNLERDPSVAVELDGRRFTARAEVVTGDDRARIWKRVVEAQPRFAGYAERTRGRQIPVVVLKEGAN
jgi:deazaflavin-dependent oxidoreductase (nitroreductase family)